MGVQVCYTYALWLLGPNPCIFEKKASFDAVKQHRHAAQVSASRGTFQIIGI